ncbi:hypothetical protein E2F47_06095 [Mycobacterium eburneum]|nr:hypothetical protein [Mycobacterium eburneum]TDH56698.1 hypothetical protein E2F47_06095 [Mycobacterium eburneum]
MSPTISQVRDWKLGDLTNTAAGLRSGADKMSEAALTIINGLNGIGTDWRGETRDRADVTGKDHYDTLTEKARRWNNAAGVLDEGAQQLGLLRTAILDRVDDPGNKQKYVIADDGNVELTDAYAKTLTTKDAQTVAETERADLETALRSLLATAGLCAQRYDAQTTGALKDSEWYDAPGIPAPTPLPTDPKTKANKDGSGPDQYHTENPTGYDRIRLQGTKGLAEHLVAGGRAAGQTYAPDLLQHFLNGSGTPMTVPVDNMFHDMPWFQQSAQDQTRATVQTAINAMPAGYKGPIAFQSDYTNQRSDGTMARPDKYTNPDWFAAMGTFSYQTSGVATPTADGHYSVAAKTSVYDYYNFETTDPHPWPQVSDLNKLQRAGWAQNFDTVGTSSVQTSTYP